MHNAIEVRHTNGSEIPGTWTVGIRLLRHSSLLYSTQAMWSLICGVPYHIIIELYIKVATKEIGAQRGNDQQVFE